MDDGACRRSARRLGAGLRGVRAMAGWNGYRRSRYPPGSGRPTIATMGFPSVA